MFRDVPECPGMFRNVPGCSMFLVLSTPSWVLEQGFLDGNFQVNVTWFFAFFLRGCP